MRVVLSCLSLVFVSAAAVSAAPAVTLKLPPGWVSKPALAQLSPVVWARARSEGAETLSALVVPLSGLPPATAMARIAARLTPPNTPIWKTEATLCGAPGLTISGHSSGELPDVEYVVEQSSGNLYLFAYAREAGMLGDAQTEQFIRTACPPSGAALPSLAPPTGWTAKTLVENLAAWQSEDGDSVIVATTSLAEAAQLSSALKSQTSSGAKPQTFSACSGTGFQMDGKGAVGSQSFNMTTFVIVTRQSAYVIYYRHGAAAADPGVVTAIRAFCPSDASTVG